MKSKLLILTPRFPYPVIGGDRLRIYQLCRALACHYRLTLLSLCDSQAEMNMPFPDDGVFHTIERMYLPKWRSWLNCALAIPGRLPLQIAYYQHAGFQRRAIELMGEHDATLAHLVRVGNAIIHAPGIKFLEMTDAISMNYNRIRKNSLSITDFRSCVYALESNRLHKYEVEIVEHFDHSFLVSEIDRKYLFDEQPGKLKQVSVFSNGVAVDLMPYQFEPAGRDVVFIGNMFSLQNFDAALYMAMEILPLVRKVHPEVRLRLIGRVKPKQAFKLAAIEGVVVTGEVPNIAEAARGGGVGVCPLRLGAGVQNKVLEYMALGLPTVSTSIGLEGFSASDGVELTVADDSHAFAAQVLRLLNDRKTASNIAKAARKYVESNHSWESVLEPMIHVIETKLNQ